MELDRLIRVIRDRWVVVVLVGFVGVAAALAFTSIANSSERMRFEATAAIKFEPQEGETIAGLGPKLDEAESIAAIAASELLLKDTTSLIVADPASATLKFVATGGTPEEAGDKAQAMRQAYFDIDPTAGASVDDLLAQLEAEAVEIEVEVGLLTEVGVEDPVVALKRSMIENEIASTAERLIALSVLDAGATAEERQGYSAERIVLERNLTTLQAESAAFPPLIEEDLTVSESLRMTTLQSRLELIATEYERLYLRKLGVTGSSGAVPVTFVDLTPAPGSSVVNAGIGFIGGLLVAIFALIMITRARKTVWLAEDLPVPVLGEVPLRRVGSLTGDLWYDGDLTSARKPAIQQLRSVLEAQLPASGSTLALASHEVSAEDAQALALDLATSMATAGTSVLLIDADLESGAALGEYRVGESSLAAALAMSSESLGFERAIESVIDGVQLMRPGLAVLPAGPPPASAADALAGRQFRFLLEKASGQFDMVLVAVGDVRSTSSRVAMQRIRRTLLVLTAGKSTIPEINGLLGSLSQTQVTILGAAFLEKKEGPIPRRRTKEEVVKPVTAAAVTATTSTEVITELGESPLERLSHYPKGGERTRIPDLAPLDSSTPTPLVGSTAPEMPKLTPAEEAGLGGDLLAALDGADSNGGFEAVAEYLVSRVEDLVSADADDLDFSDELLEQVKKDGFVPLRPVANRRTIGKLLEDELKRTVRPQTAMAIVDEMEVLLSSRVGRAVYLDDWLADQFFTRHVARTGGNPYVWHLTSSSGTLQILVAAQMLDRERIELFMTEIGEAAVAELERYRRAADTRGDLEQAETFAARINEIRHFETALGQLVGVSYETGPSGGGGRVRKSEDSWMWNPDWVSGTRVNLAPIQRVGLLPFPVLSEDEMSAVLTPK